MGLTVREAEVERKMADRVSEALDGLSARELERLREQIDRRLATCVLCNSDGAVAVNGASKVTGNSVRFSMMLCPACIERHRLPEGRSDQSSNEPSSSK